MRAEKKHIYKGDRSGNKISSLSENSREIGQ